MFSNVYMIANQECVIFNNFLKIFGFTNKKMIYLPYSFNITDYIVAKKNSAILVIKAS